jgi:hypothetical protein
VPTLLESMNAVFTPHSNKLWELAGNLYAGNGELDATRLSDAEWQQLAAAATALRDSATAMANAEKVRVAPDGAKVLNEGTPGALGAADIQALIDADPKGFSAEATAFAGIAADALAAASAKDAAKADDTSNRLNEACTACHNRFWYPGQPQ